MLPTTPYPPRRHRKNAASAPSVSSEHHQRRVHATPPHYLSPYSRSPMTPGSPSSPGDVFVDEEPAGYDAFLSTLKGSLDRIVRERSCTLATGGGHGMDEPNGHPSQQTAMERSEYQRRQRMRSKSLGASVHTISSAVHSGVDEQGYAEDNEDASGFDDEEDLTENDANTLSAQRRSSRYDSMSSARFSSSTSSTVRYQQVLYPVTLSGVAPSPSAVAPRSTRTSEERNTSSASVVGNVGRYKSIPAVPCPAPPPSYMPKTSRHRAQASFASSNGGTNDAGASRRYYHSRNVSSIGSQWPRPGSISSTASGGMLSPPEDYEYRHSWGRSTITVNAAGVGYDFSSPNTTGRSNGQSPMSEEGPAPTPGQFVWANRQPSDGATTSGLSGSTLPPLPPMVTLLGARDSNSSSGLPSFDELPGMQTPKSEQKTKRESKQHYSHVMVGNSANQSMASLISSRASTIRSAQNANVGMVGPRYLPKSGSATPNTKEYMLSPGSSKGPLPAGTVNVVVAPTRANVTLAEVLPLATQYGRLTTRYMTRGVFGTRQVWKARYFVLVAHTLYRFKSDDPSSVVLDMMKLTPKSVAFVSDEYPGKQWCLELHGSCSSLLPGSSRGQPSDAPGGTAAPHPTGTLIWEAGKWYADAPDGDSLKLWLNALKSAVIRSAYATRDLPPPPPGHPLGGSTSDLSQVSMQTTPAGSIRHGSTRAGSSRNPSVSTLPPPPSNYQQSVYGIKSPPLPPGGISSSLPSMMSPAAYASETTPRAEKKDVQRLLIDTSFASLDAPSGSDSQSATVKDSSISSTTDKTVSTMGSTPLAAKGIDRRTKARSWALQGEISSSLFSEPVRPAPKLVDQATSPIGSPVQESDFVTIHEMDVPSITSRINGITHEGKKESVSSVDAMVAPKDTTLADGRPKLPRRYTSGTTKFIASNDMLSVISNGFFGRSSGEESSAGRMTTPEGEDGGGSSSASGLVSNGYISGSLGRNRAETAPFGANVPSSLTNGILSDVTSPPPSAGSETKFKFLSFFHRHSKPSISSTPPREQASPAPPSDTSASLAPTPPMSRRPSAGTLGLLSALSPVLEARSEDLEAPISQGARKKI